MLFRSPLSTLLFDRRLLSSLLRAIAIVQSIAHLPPRPLHRLNRRFAPIARRERCQQDLETASIAVGAVAAMRIEE